MHFWKIIKFLWNQRVVNDSVFFIVNKSYLITNFSFFREKRLHIFPLNFYCHWSFLDWDFENNFPLFFVQSPAVIFLFFKFC